MAKKNYKSRELEQKKKKAAELRKKRTAHKLSKSQLAVISAVVVVIVGLLITIMVSLLTGAGAVAKIGNHAVTDEEMNIYSAMSLNQLYTSYGITDFSTEITTGYTFRDYAKNMALQWLQETYVQKDLAIKAGMTLTQENLDSMEQEKKTLIETRGSETAANNYLKETYGVSLDYYFNVRKDMLLANQFVISKTEEFKITEEEALEKYNGTSGTTETYPTKRDYDKVTAHYVYIAAETPEGATALDLAAAKAKAEEFVTSLSTEEDNFDALAKEYTATATPSATATAAPEATATPEVTATPEPTLAPDATATPEPTPTPDASEYTVTYGSSSTNAQVKDWCFDESRKANDVAIVADADETDTSATVKGYYVVRFDKRTVFEDIKTDMIDSLADTAYSDYYSKIKYEDQYYLKINEKVLNAF